MREIENEIAIIILAAGSSSRLGQPKQLLKFGGQTLIRNAVETALKSDVSKVIVVLGSEFEKIKKEIEDLDCLILSNENWQTGMSSSIKNGLENLLENSPNISAVIIALCDQPFVESKHFNQLIDEFYQTKKSIVAAFYNEKFGVPALFSSEKFPDLLKLEGDQGARKILNENPENTGKIDLPEAVFDVDTQADFEKIETLNGI